MKKNILLAAGAVLLAAAVSAFVYVKNGQNSMDELFNANVEALADTESGNGKAICYSQYSQNPTMRCLVCGDCVYVDGVGVTKGGYCRW